MPIRLPKPEEDTTTYLDWWFCSNACLNAAIEDETPAHYRAKATERDDPDVKAFLRKYGQEETSETLRADYWALVARWKKRKVEELSDAKRRLSYRIGREDFALLNKELDASIEASVERGRKADEKFRQEMEDFHAETRRAQALRDFQAQQLEELIQPRPIPQRLRFEHTHIIGPSGSGKTTLIQHLIRCDLYEPNPPAYVVIDPKGRILERLSRLSLFDPTNGPFRDRLVIIQPNERPALNIFDMGSASFGQDEHEAVTNQLIEMFGYIFSSSDARISQRQSVPFSFVVRLVLMMGGNIETLMDVLEDTERKFEPQIAQLSATNPGARRFFANEFYTKAFAPTREQIRTRLYEIISRPQLMHMFASGVNKLDMFDCMQKGKIVLVNTDMGLLGTKGSQLLGRYIIAKTLNAAFSRQFIPESQWNPAFLVIDEFQDYADEEKIPEVLRLAREYKLGVTIAHQVMHAKELSAPLQATISTNTSIKFCSTPEGIDQNYMARDLRCEVDFFKTHTGLGRFACFVRGMEPPLQHPFIFRSFVTMPGDTNMSDAAHAVLMEKNKTRLSATRKAPEASAPLPQRDQPTATPPPPPPRASRPSADDPEAGSTW